METFDGLLTHLRSLDKNDAETWAARNLRVIAELAQGDRILVLGALEERGVNGVIMDQVKAALLPKRTPRPVTTEAPEDGPPPVKRWELAEILTAKFADPAWAVPGLIPAGLSIIAGRPKLGKSWFALQVGIAVATGGRVLDQKVDRRKVLFVALEDSPRRIQSRLKLQRCPMEGDVHFLNEFRGLIDGGVAMLRNMVEAEGYGLVVIDTLARFAPTRKADDEALVARELMALQQFAINHNVAVMLVDHHRKSSMGVQDVIDDVMGATAKTGVADAALGLYRQRGQSDATLKITGRDLEDKELVVRFDRDLYSWQLIGNASEVVQSRVQGDLLDAIDNNFNGVATCKLLAEFLGKSKSNLHVELQELVSRGLLRRRESGREVQYERSR